MHNTDHLVNRKPLASGFSVHYLKYMWISTVCFATRKSCRKCLHNFYFDQCAEKCTCPCAIIELSEKRQVTYELTFHFRREWRW